jgi:hypothetical protein
MDSETILSATKTQKLIIAEWATLLSVFIVCFLFLFYRIEKLDDRCNQLHQDLTTVMQAQTERSDHLYEMFIELVKEGRK